jgi:MtrB/PioB family decaheme-associated outer membrane protein
MKTRHYAFSQGVLARAMQLALLAMFAAPALVAAQTAKPSGEPPEFPDKATVDEPQAVGPENVDPEEVKNITCPKSFIDLGGQYLSKGAPKFGEYNGMTHSGGYGIGNFNFARGGCERADTTHWRVFGYNLGTTSRNVGVEGGQQGKWSIGLTFDQLRHYTTTGFQTPFQEGQGSNVFTLPATFGTISSTAPSATAPVAAVNNMTAAQLAAFHTVNVYNERKNTTFNAGFAFNTEWNVNFQYKRIDMSGAKLIGGGSESMTGAPGGLSWANQTISLKLNPNKSTTDMFTLDANWAGTNAYATFEYYGSLYHDDYSGLSWANPFTAAASSTVPAPQQIINGFPMDTMSTPPSNQFHQLNFTGGYFISKATRLTGGLSFGVNTQNMSYDGSYTPGFATLPTGVNSLNGRVLTKHADAMLTHKFSDSLDFSAGFKYNERDNNTPVNTYHFILISGTAPTNNNVVNAPMSNRRTQFDANLDYRIDKYQKLHLGYDYDRMQRWCNNALASTGAVTAGAPAGYAPTSCAQVPSSTDNALTLSYKRVIMGNIDMSAGYTFANRDATLNPWFYNPMQNFTQGYENLGWLAYFQAPRREHTLKARLNWQASDRFSLGVSGRFIVDN